MTGYGGIMIDSRRRLAHDEEGLLRALLYGEAVPEGFDAFRVGLAARQLTEKRWTRVAHLRPALALALGPAGATIFHSYATRVPLPLGGAEADARCFFREAMRAAELPGDARSEEAAASARFRAQRVSACMKPFHLFVERMVQIRRYSGARDARPK